MPLNQTLANLLETARQGAREEDRAYSRGQARLAWIEERIADLKAAQKRADEAWFRLVDAHPDEDEDLPPPPEQAELDAILAELWAVRDKDLWPKDMYFTV